MDDRDVVGVEQLDVVASVLAAVPDRLDRQVDAKTRKQMSTPKMSTVAPRLIRLGKFWR